MFSSKAKKRPNSDITPSFLDDFGTDKADNELQGFLFNSASSKENTFFRTPEVIRAESRASNHSTPLQATMTPVIEKPCFKTPSPAGRMTSTPKQVVPEEVNRSEDNLTNQNAATSNNPRPIERPNLDDSALQQLSSILNPDDLRQVGSYSVSQLEEEYERLIMFIKDEREKHAHHVSDLIQAMRDRVDRLASDLENMIEQRFQTLDQCLQDAMENFERELNNGKAVQEELLNLRQKIASIVNMHLQAPVKMTNMQVPQ